ncbi:MAG: alkaline phosphatase family protein [Proteobacteria bacterium]|jgi:alkaline phosphatase D|nr:alkaline phosphatase family protein [Pseudomonadota bacterium]
MMRLQSVRYFHKSSYALMGVVVLSLLACQSSTKSPQAPIAELPVVIAPVQTEAILTRVALGSCSTQKAELPILKKIMGVQPQLYVAMGDNVYASRPEDKPISAAYKKQEQRPEFNQFRAVVPMIATWDDHDFGQNDGGASNPEKQEARNEFLKFFPYSQALIPQDRDGVYHSMIFGPKGKMVQFIMLDTRWNRSDLEKPKEQKHKFHIYEPSQDKTKTVLGETQWKWLEAELKKPAQVRFLVSSIQVLPQEHGFEKWENFPHERQRLLNLIEKLKVKNLVIVSGDRHFSEFSQIKQINGRSLLEMTASAINRPGSLPEESNRWRLGPKYDPVNFGLAEINWEKKTMTLSLRDIEGKVIHQVEQKF